MDTKTQRKIPVLIDADPGCDDFFALIWTGIMHKQQYIDLKAITTTAGNVNAKATFTNAVRAIDLLNLKNIPIGKVPGKSDDDSHDASHIHGNDGIGGLGALLPPPSEVQAHDSVDLIIKTIEENEGEIELLVVGPMTNLANAEAKKPGILKKAKRIIAMGGTFFKHGNVSPVAEFNVWFDPTSAKKVIETSGANIVLVPLDTTETLLFGVEDLKPVLSHINNETARNFLLKLCEFTIGTNMEFRETHYKKGFFVHDASTLGMLLYPHLYQGSFFNVMVEDQGEYTKGQTIVDLRNQPKTSINTYVVLKADKLGFLEAMTEDFKRFDFSK